MFLKKIPLIKVEDIISVNFAGCGIDLKAINMVNIINADKFFKKKGNWFIFKNIYFLLLIFYCLNK